VRRIGAQIDDETLDRALRRWSRTALAFDIYVGRDRYEFFHSKEVPGALVAFRNYGKADAVLGEVLAPEEHLQAVCREYFSDRIARRRAVLGFSVPRSFAEAAVEAGAAAVQFTAEPELDPAHYKPSGKHAKKLRSYVKRLRLAGVEGVEAEKAASSAAFRNSADHLIDTWLAHGPPRNSHLLEVDPWIGSEHKRYFAVPNPEEPNQLWSLLIAHPIWARSGWHLCHLMHAPEAPRGVNELAVLTAIERLGEEGCRYATFGPFSSPTAGNFLGFGRIWHPLLKYIYDTVARRVGYAHTLEFYEKVQAPPWADRYMVMTPRHFPVRALGALMELTHVLGTHGRHPVLGHPPRGKHRATQFA